MKHESQKNDLKKLKDTIAFHEKVDDFISDELFGKFQRFMLEQSGVSLSANKKMLVLNRLRDRVAQISSGDYLEYYLYITQGRGVFDGEKDHCVDALTTNETYFFREPKQYEFLRKLVIPELLTKKKPVNIWSAACSSGEEVYSLAMLLADGLTFHRPWSVLGTDISYSKLELAKSGIYSDRRMENVPQKFYDVYLSKGFGDQAGNICAVSEIRERVEFEYCNLTLDTPNNRHFDVIFCRNVLIYFEPPTVVRVINLLCSRLRLGGYLFTAQSEPLRNISFPLMPVSPSIYRKVNKRVCSG